MPLYMDFHKFENITVEAVKSAHIADLKVQDEYGVRYHQFWVNQETGSVFCLVEGPDKETCEKVHQMAHGNVACALTEVEAGVYERLMGKYFDLDEGHVQRIDGTEDLGYRNILVISVFGITSINSIKDLDLLLRPFWARELITKKIKSYKGRELKWGTDDSLIGIFDDTNDAVQCAMAIRYAIDQNAAVKIPEVIFKIGISASQPVTKEGDFFTQAIRLAHQLSLSAPDNAIRVSALVKKLCSEQVLASLPSVVRPLNDTEEDFVSRFLTISQAKLSDLDFNLDELCSEICVSRPQLYRKIIAITGRSPNDFMRDLRMNKALELLKQKKSNISEIAFETGYNSPSYFTKCFTEKFGCPPSMLTKDRG